MPLQDLGVGGSDWQESLEAELASNFYPDQILRDAAASGDLTVPDDGGADWLAQLPAIGSAIFSVIGIDPTIDGGGGQMATPVSYGGGGSVAGLPISTIAIVGVVALGIYLVAVN